MFAPYPKGTADTGAYEGMDPSLASVRFESEVTGSERIGGLNAG